MPDYIDVTSPPASPPRETEHETKKETNAEEGKADSDAEDNLVIDEDVEQKKEDEEAADPKEQAEEEYEKDDFAARVQASLAQQELEGNKGDTDRAAAEDASVGGEEETVTEE